MVNESLYDFIILEVKLLKLIILDYSSTMKDGELIFKKRNGQILKL